MSRLVNPGLGDILDRLSILALKILRAPEAADRAYWQKERTTLLAQVVSRTGSAAWWAEALDLAAVNAWLWENEDSLRRVRATIDRGPTAGAIDDLRIEAGTIAMQTQRLNDRRAELVDTINKVAGDDRGEEKQR